MHNSAKPKQTWITFNTQLKAVLNSSTNGWEQLWLLKFLLLSFFCRSQFLPSSLMPPSSLSFLLQFPLFLSNCCIYCALPLSLLLTFRVLMGHGKPGKPWNFKIWFSRPGKSSKLSIGHGNSWKMKFYNGLVQTRFSSCFFCEWKSLEEKINES